MPEIDVSEDVLLDGFVAAVSFVVVRRRSWTDSNGIAQQSAQRVPAIGSVYADGDQSLDRDEGYQMQAKTIKVVTRFYLRGAAEDADGVNWQPDLVLWQGDYFLVHDVEDYSQYGVGMVAATCESYDYVVQPPVDNPPSVSTGHLDFRNRLNSGLGGACS